jgi:hypothetical protein
MIDVEDEMIGVAAGCMAGVAIGWMAIQITITLELSDAGNQAKRTVCLGTCESNTCRSTRSGTG